jgi:mxaD protein
VNRFTRPGSRLLVILLPLIAFAHGPTPRRVTQTIDIAAPPAKVWKIVGDFGGMASWHPMVAKCVADKGNKVDSQREVTLKNGAGLVDSMDFYDVPNKTYTYRLMNQDIQKFPVGFYSATITVKAAGAGSEVEWVGNFYRADTQNEPPENLNDEAAEKAMTEFLQSGLQGLKAAVEH